MLFKKLISTLLVFTITWAAPMQQVAHAQVNPNKALGGLLNSAQIQANSPALYNSQSRYFGSLGGLSVRYPNTKVSLFSITPPSLIVGCNGIDGFFGGFGFINLDQFAELLSNISQVAIGTAIMTAIRATCGICASVLDHLTTISKMAKLGNLDSCALGSSIGQAVGKSFADSTGLTAALGDYKGPEKGEKKLGEFCKQSSTMTGVAESIESAAVNACNSIGQSIQTVNNFIDSLSQTNPDAANDKADVKGNTTWLALKSLGFEEIWRREIVMSLVGTTVNAAKQVCFDDDSSAGNNESPTTYYGPSIQDPSKVLHFLMCGTTGLPPNLETQFSSLCGNPSGDESEGITAVLACVTPSNCGQLEIQTVSSTTTATADFTVCDTVNYIEFNSWASQRNTNFDGLIKTVHKTLSDAVIAVKGNNAVSKEAKQLFSIIPLPLYQMVNIAAVYPDISANLVEDSSGLVASLIAQRIITESILQTSRVKGSTLSPAIMGTAREALKSLSSRVEAQKKAAVDSLTYQSQIMARVQEINKMIQNEVLSQGLLSNTVYSVGVGNTAGINNGNATPTP